MSVGAYNTLKTESYFSPSFSPISTYRSSNVPIFSSRRNMSKNGRNVPRKCFSAEEVHSSSEKQSTSHDLRVKGIFDGIASSVYDSGMLIWRKIVGATTTRDEDGQLTKLDGHEAVKKRSNEFDAFQLPRKRRSLKEHQSDETILDITSRAQENDELCTLHFSKDPFNWNDWKTSEIEPREDARQTQQYGTTLIRRSRSPRKLHGNNQLTPRAQSDEVKYLKTIYNGEYQVPKILEDERENQLSLLQRDKDSQLKKTIVDLTQKIKNILVEREGASSASDDDFMIVSERKVSSLERKRYDFQRRRVNVDRALHQLDIDEEFKTYRQLIEERKHIQDEVRKKKDGDKGRKLVPDIGQDESNKVKKTLRRSDNGILSNRDNFEVTVRDFKTLTPRRWLNDTVIEFFMKQIEKNSKGIVAFNSFFYTTLSERGYQGVRRWMKRKKAQINDLEKIFVPVNLNQSHWALGMIDISRKRIVYVDSLSNGPNAMSFAILNDLQNYVIEESKNTMDADFELENLRCPQQPNGFDCGIYLCMNTLYLSQDAPLTFDQHDAVRMRAYIAHLILSKKS
ncbi:SUMO protease ULP1 TDEL_0C01000 [Torulaspora delbrueckii]|uniref:Ubiquitin-like protease family profile domain-containing protein n=1 Tax=Torulaspora delbrueckii TaxID=4950 RepID=G8ZR47_TORDE|nr:hypothetical protein TDEL_0C01000 [Torulaspora delbrueckii]CCE90989.1 hypothetical protein TDEL_0C01000 [Torulaspora delbrueckii]